MNNNDEVDDSNYNWFNTVMKFLFYAFLTKNVCNKMHYLYFTYYAQGGVYWFSIYVVLDYERREKFIGVKKMVIYVFFFFLYVFGQNESCRSFGLKFVIIKISFQFVYFKEVIFFIFRVVFLSVKKNYLMNEFYNLENNK